MEVLIAEALEACELQPREIGQHGELSKDLTEPLCPANSRSRSEYLLCVLPYGNRSITRPTYSSLATTKQTHVLLLHIVKGCLPACSF